MLRFIVPLDPYTLLRIEQEKQRAANARKHKKVKRVIPHFPSVNHIYPINRRTGRKYLSPEGGLWKDYICDCCCTSGKLAPSHWIYFDCTYVYYLTRDMFFTKDDRVREVDVSNWLKASEDALFDWLMESDHKVLGIHGYKRIAEISAKLVIYINQAKLTDPLRVGGPDGQLISCSELDCETE